MKEKTKLALKMTLQDIEISLIVCVVAVLIVGTVVMISIGIIESAKYFADSMIPISGWEFVRIFIIFGAFLLLAVIFLAYRENINICKRGGL